MHTVTRLLVCGTIAATTALAATTPASAAWKVTATGGGATASGSVSGTPGTGSPAAPSCAGQGTVTVRWSLGTTSANATGFKVYKNGALFFTVSGRTTTSGSADIGNSSGTFAFTVRPSIGNWVSATSGSAGSYTKSANGNGC